MTPSLIEKYIKKSDNLSKEELEDNFRGIDENFELEFKSIPTNPDLKDVRFRKLLDPLVCFLNSPSGKGLLGLGIKTKKNKKTFDKIVGIPKELNPFKNELTLETAISNYIDSVPQFTNRYGLKIVKINIDDSKNSYLVEIERKDNFCVYYSKYHCPCYIRDEDNCNKLSLREFFSYVSEKTYPKIYVDFDYSIKKNELVFRPHFINEGYKPGFNVQAVVIICYDAKKEDFDFSGDFFRGYGDIERHSEQLKKLGVYEDTQFFDNRILRVVPINHPINRLHNPLPLYPFSPSQSKFTIKLAKKRFNMVITSLIYEETILTIQITSITYREGKDPIIIDIKREYKPYIM